MPVEEASVPPIVKELAGDDNGRLGVAVQAYMSLWEMYACGKNGGLRNDFEKWVAQPKHSWLEQPPDTDEPTPLVRMRKAIEEEKQRLLNKGLDPCRDFSLN